MDREENPLEIYQTLANEGYTIFVSEVESARMYPICCESWARPVIVNPLVSN